MKCGIDFGDKGREELDRILLDAIETVHSFYGEYLQNLRPKINVFAEFLQPITEELRGHENIAFITTKYYGMQEMMISFFQRKTPNGRIYFVKPKFVTMELNIDNLFLLDGTYDNIPLKDELPLVHLVTPLELEPLSSK